jgi:hypothetical protein
MCKPLYAFSALALDCELEASLELGPLDGQREAVLQAPGSDLVVGVVALKGRGKRHLKLSHVRQVWREIAAVVLHVPRRRQLPPRDPVHVDVATELGLLE